MKKRVDWVLKNNSYEIVVNSGIMSEFIPKKEIVVYENDAKNKIDIAARIYERQCSDYVMTVDFKKGICSFVFSSEDKCSFDVKASFLETKNSIVLKYSLDEDEKEIIVSWKD